MNKQLFLSHAWKPDSLGRNTHDRAKMLRNALVEKGWSVWFDEDDMKLNIDASMISGIENADVVLVCLTKEYTEQINQCAFSLVKLNSNCAKEWNYALARKKIIIALLFEADVISSQWPRGVVTMTLCNQMYIDATKDDMHSVSNDLIALLNKIHVKKRLRTHDQKKTTLILHI